MPSSHVPSANRSRPNLAQRAREAAPKVAFVAAGTASILVSRVFGARMMLETGAKDALDQYAGTLANDSPCRDTLISEGDKHAEAMRSNAIKCLCALAGGAAAAAGYVIAGCCSDIAAQ